MGTTSLFRSEALTARRRRLHGDISLHQSPRTAAAGGLLMLVFAALLGFAAFAGYADKQTASGYLVPAGGVVRIQPPIAGGRITAVDVAEGQSVAAGDRLLRLSTARDSVAGATVESALLALIDDELATLGEGIAGLAEQGAHERARLDALLEGYRAERRTLRDEQLQQRERVALTARRVESASTLQRRGLLAARDLDELVAGLARERQQFAGIGRELVRVDAAIARTRIDHRQLPLRQAERRRELVLQRSALAREQVEYRARDELAVTSPVAGRVAALQAVAGGTAGDQPLLVIVPAAATLEAHVYVPDRAIAFVEAGQLVRLAVDAHDYRQFGWYAGTVREVAATALAPQEIAAPVVVSEPVYRVTVALESLADAPPGRRDAAPPLRAGMAVSAQIVLGQRSLLAWLLDPLLARGQAT